MRGFFLLPFYCFTGSTGAGIHKLKLQKTAERLYDGPTIQEADKETPHVYLGDAPDVEPGYPLKTDGASSSGPDHPLPILNIVNTQYISEVFLGTPPQSFKVMIHTSSNDLWLTSILCNATECSVHHRYNASSSSTFLSRHDWGVAIGHTSQDTLTLDNLTIERQDFGEATEEPGPYFQYASFDGVLGLGLNETSANGLRPPFHQMVQQNLLDRPIFSIYLDGTNGSSESEIVFGGLDKGHFDGPMRSLPVRSAERWEITVDSLTFGDESTSFDDLGVTLNTAWPAFGMPTNLAVYLNSIIYKRASPDGIHIPCGARRLLPDLVLIVSGNNFSISPEDYLYESFGGSCASALFAMNFPDPVAPPIVLGRPFLRRWYSVFDVGNRTVSLARAKG